MQTEVPIRSRSHSKEMDYSPTLKAVIIYDTVPAGRRAIRVLDSKENWMEDATCLEPQLWRFDFLEDPDWFALALADAINSDIIVISTCSIGELSPSVKSWLKLCLIRKRGTSAAIVALLGPEDKLDGPASPRFQFIQRAALMAGLDFFAPQPPLEILSSPSV